MRRLTQALGTVRELDVSLHLIDELVEIPAIPRAALGEVRAAVIEAREKRRAVMLERIAKVNTAKLNRRLGEVASALAAPTPGHNWRAVLALRIVRRARRLEKAIDHAGQIYAPEALHLVRIAAKKLRYSLEIADESGVAPCADTLKTIKRVQESLGRLHDLQVLQHYVADVAAAPRPRRGTPDAGLAALSRLIEDQCRHLHARYIAVTPALREAAESARRDVPARLTARHRSAKMALPPRGRRRGSRTAGGRTAGGRT